MGLNKSEGLEQGLCLYKMELHMYSCDTEARDHTDIEEPAWPNFSVEEP